VNEKEERRLLSHLFWGHLVEARYAVRGPDARASLSPSSQQKSRVIALV
jgi:hypothetical protein